MKRKKYICESCGDGSNQTHMHHILPKSKGGTDLPSNLVEVCPPCHQKIHDATFNGDSGLIKSGIKKTRIESNKAIEFMDRNSESLMIFFEDFCEEYETEVLHEMMRFNVLSASEFLRMIRGERTKKDFGLISGMVRALYKKPNNSYNFTFNP